MVNLVQNISKEKKGEENEIFINSTQLVDGIIVKIKNKYYKINLTADQSSFVLTQAYLIDSNIVLNK